MALVNIKDIKVTFSQNVLYLMKDDFKQKTVNHNKMTLAGFSQREGHNCSLFPLLFPLWIIFKII